MFYHYFIAAIVKICCSELFSVFSVHLVFFCFVCIETIQQNEMPFIVYLDSTLPKSPSISHSTLNYTTPLSNFTATVKVSWPPCMSFTVALATCEKAPLPMTLTMLTCLRLISQLLVEG